MNSRTPRDLRAAVPVGSQPDGVLQFIFEPDIFSGSVVHFHDWPEFFSPEECRAAGILGTRPLQAVQGLPRVMLIHACDYQVCATWDGLAALDFEPNNWLVKLADVNGLELPKPKAQPEKKVVKLAEVPRPTVAPPAPIPAELTQMLEEMRGDMRELRRAVAKLRRTRPAPVDRN